MYRIEVRWARERRKNGSGTDYGGGKGQKWEVGEAAEGPQLNLCEKSVKNRMWRGVL